MAKTQPLPFALSHYIQKEVQNAILILWPPTKTLVSALFVRNLTQQLPKSQHSLKTEPFPLTLSSTSQTPSMTTH